MQESLRQGKVVELPSVNTIADGTAVKCPGDKLFPYIQENVDDIITIEDSELDCRISGHGRKTIR